MLRKKNFLIFMIAFFVVGLLGCTSAESNSSNSKKDSDSLSFPMTITDVTGREISIDKEPQKIISLSPAVTEILYELQVEDKVIGVTKYCDYPAEAKDKPKIGDFEKPNIEVIVSMEPDIVFTSAGIQKSISKQFDDLGITAIVLDSENLDGVLKNIELAGKITGSHERAKEIVSNLNKRIEAIDDKIATTIIEPLVFFETWDVPLTTAGSGSFIDSLIERAGGKNVAGNAKEPYPKFSLEVLLEKDPDIYIINDHAHEPEDIKKRNGYEGLKAIKNDKVFSVEDDLVTLPGPRIVDGLEELAKIIHPEAF